MLSRVALCRCFFVFTLPRLLCLPPHPLMLPRLFLRFQRIIILQHTLCIIRTHLQHRHSCASDIDAVYAAYYATAACLTIIIILPHTFIILLDLCQTMFMIVMLRLPLLIIIRPSLLIMVPIILLLSLLILFNICLLLLLILIHISCVFFFLYHHRVIIITVLTLLSHHYSQQHDSSSSSEYVVQTTF